MKIAAEHTKGQGITTGHGMEIGFFLHRVALHRRAPPFAVPVCDEIDLGPGAVRPMRLDRFELRQAPGFGIQGDGVIRELLK